MGAFIHDLYRYKAYDDKPLWVHFFLQRCVWAIFQYRVSNAIYRSRIPRVLKSLLLKGCLLWKFFVELLTGISIRYGTTIGKGLYIGHTGNIRISAQAIIGEYCNIVITSYSIHYTKLYELCFKESCKRVRNGMKRRGLRFFEILLFGLCVV